MKTHKGPLVNCEEHGKYPSLYTVLESGIRIPIPDKCPECEKEEIDTRNKGVKAEEEFAAKRMILENIENSGIPTRFQSSRFDNYISTNPGQEMALKIALKYVEKWDERLKVGGGLTFIGNPGTGKTHLACSVAREILKTGAVVEYTSMVKITRRVKDTWSPAASETETEIYGKLIKPDLLIIDEIGVGLGTDSDNLITFQIINGRYEEVKPTILISNLEEGEMVKFIGDRSFDRLREGKGAVIAFNWDSFRK
ncbi:ATP-binding protein [Candidatus Pacearchaeota archaeon]|nr:ATP-binding protein [Candidatus Pacearchaeota archaeon]